MSKIKLTEDQILSLPESEKPGYEGYDEKGIYKIDIYGDKKRPFERGGPSPNKAGPKPKKVKKPVMTLLEENDWADPLEFMLAVMNADVKFLNKNVKASEKLKSSDLSLNLRLKAAEKALPYARTPEKGEDGDTYDSSPSEEVGVLSLPSSGRAALITKE